MAAACAQDLAAARRAIAAAVRRTRGPTIARSGASARAASRTPRSRQGKAASTPSAPSLARLQARSARPIAPGARADLHSARGVAARARWSSPAWSCSCWPLVAAMLGLAASSSGRSPALARRRRGVAAGDLRPAPSSPVGPREIARLGADVDAMRERILRELAAVRDAARELGDQAVGAASARTPSSSSSPTSPRTTCRSRCARWRASASCSSAATRASSTSAADQYIAFAVDGAKRMQTLINDLLAFSRVGRHRAPARRRRPRRAASSTRASDLSWPIEETRRHASRCAATCPTVRGERSLLGLVFQNLIGNAIKFRGDDPPVVRVSARRDGEQLGARRHRQRHRHRARVRRPDLRHLPAPARRGTSTRAPASAWRCAGRSSSTTAGASGSSPRRTAPGRPSASPCRSDDIATEEAMP